MAKRRKGPSLAGIIKQYFADHPEWLAAQDTSAVVAQFKKDHPNKEVSKKVMQAIYNTKSTLRKGKKGAAKRKQTKAAANQLVTAAQKAGTPSAPLSMLEEQIDDCMILTKQIDRERLHNVLAHLRAARNAIVVMLEA
jgi:hypothetical protein